MQPGILRVSVRHLSGLSGIRLGQTYDIIFRRPRFGKDGTLLQPATLTVLHNGVLVQDCEKLTGPTAHKKRPSYRPHGKIPLVLEEHHSRVRFRNIWIRQLDETKR